MKFTMETIVVSAFLGMLFVPVLAAELDSGFMDTKWATPAKDLKGFTEVGGSEKIAYYLPIAKQANAEIQKNLEVEPLGPSFPLNPFSNYDGPVPNHQCSAGVQGICKHPGVR
jgi:hypothetical protein